jgi:hypothetical protein
MKSVSQSVGKQIYDVADRNIRGDVFKKAVDGKISYKLFSHVHLQICLEVWAQVSAEVNIQLKENIIHEIRK